MRLADLGQNCCAVKFSIVACSRNRAKRLPGFLAAVSALDYPKEDWELIFVNSGSTDDTAEVFEKCIAEMGVRYTYTHETKCGVNNARNTGVAVARNDVLVFIDDDCYVSQDLLRQYRDEYEMHDVGFIGGQVRPGPSGVRLSIQEHGTTELIRPYGFLRAGLIHGANMSIRRQALMQCWMFDGRFGPGGAFLSGSDVETLARILFAGWHGLYSPKPCVQHDRGRMPDIEINRVRRNYDIVRGAYYMKMMLHARARPVYIRHWCGRILLRLSSGRVTTVLREFQGALRFLRNHITHFPERRSSIS